MLAMLLCPDRVEETCHAAPLREVASVHSANDIREAVRRARTRTLSLDCSGLDHILCLDEARGLIEVQCGIRWDVLAAYPAPALDGARAALSAMAADPGLPRSVGEVLCMNAPGPDGRAVAAHVEALTLVMADGELRRASRGVNPELFRVTVGGFGLCGILYSVTLRLESLASCVPHRGQSMAAADLELFLPPERADGFLRAAEEELGARRVALAGCEARLIALEEATLLRPAPGEWMRLQLSLAAPATLSGKVRVTHACRWLIDAAIAHGGSLSLAAGLHASREQVEACYPTFGALLAEKRRHDPAGRLQNAWYRHYRGLLSREACEVRWAA